MNTLYCDLDRPARIAESRAFEIPVEQHNVRLPQKESCHFRKGEIASLDISEDTRLHLTILSGEAWVTMEGDPTDYVLGTKARFTGTTRGRLVIEALVDLELEFEMQPGEACIPAT